MAAWLGYHTRTPIRAAGTAQRPSSKYACIQCAGLKCVLNARTTMGCGIGWLAYLDLEELLLGQAADKRVNLTQHVRLVRLEYVVICMR